MGNSIAIKVGFVVVAFTLLACALYRGSQMQRARSRELLPKPGEIPTDEHVKRLVEAGEKIMAIKLYRQMHRTGLADAKAAVEKLAKESGSSNAAPRV